MHSFFRATAPLVTTVALVEAYKMSRNNTHNTRNTFKVVHAREDYDSGDFEENRSNKRARRYITEEEKYDTMINYHKITDPR